jgi:NAD(P)H-hydrate epimerase
VRADATVTFAAPKPAQVLFPAAALVGELVVADLGVPPALVERVGGDLHLLLADELLGALPRRRPDAHKGDFGHVLVVAGGPGKTGAAVLAARAAVRAGAGLVTAAVPAPLVATVAAGALESMTLALPAGADGALAGEAVAALLAAAAERDVVALGPGLGLAEATAAAVREFVAACPKPLVLDADGVNAFAGRAEELAARRGGAALVLTPHPGEMGRLLGTSTAEVQADRPAAARRAAAACRAVVVLKGHRSLVAAPAGGVWVVPTGNPGMATGGTGDVLTGALAALLAQLGDPLAAARLAVYAHGLAGDDAAERVGEVGLAAGDVLDGLPAALARFEG